MIGNNPKGVKVSVVMPCLNEEGSIAYCIDKAFEGIKKTGLSGEVVVSDNGSTDNSVRIARSHGARVVHQPKRGYGNAYIKGLSEARGKYIVMADSDKTYDFTEIKRFVDPLMKGYDMVMGTRLKGKIMPGAMPWLHQHIGNPLLSWFLNVLFKTGVSDSHCGMRGFTKDAFERMHLKTTGMEFASEMVINSSKAGLKIKEVPITLYANNDRKPHLRSFSDGWRHLKFMILYSPFHLFFLPGIILMIAGFAMLLGLSFSGAKLFGLNLGPISAILFSLLVLIGLQMITLGYFSKIVYSKMSSFEDDKKFKGVLRFIDDFFSIENSMIAFIVLLVVGIAINALILYKWFNEGFGTLSTTDGIISIFGVTLIFVGVQMLFSSFFSSILKAFIIQDTT
jgi:glycosyltransferase involved in cell wall biosynthesis